MYRICFVYTPYTGRGGHIREINERYTNDILDIYIPYTFRICSAYSPISYTSIFFPYIFFIFPVYDPLQKLCLGSHYGKYGAYTVTPSIQPPKRTPNLITISVTGQPRQQTGGCDADRIGFLRWHFSEDDSNRAFASPKAKSLGFLVKVRDWEKFETMKRLLFLNKNIQTTKFCKFRIGKIIITQCFLEF